MLAKGLCYGIPEVITHFLNKLRKISTESIFNRFSTRVSRVSNNKLHVEFPKELPKEFRKGMFESISKRFSKTYYGILNRVAEGIKEMHRKFSKKFPKEAQKK